MNPAFNEPFLPNPFAAREEPPAPQLYEDTIILDQRRSSYVVLLHPDPVVDLASMAVGDLCLEGVIYTPKAEKDAQIAKLQEEIKLLKDGHGQAKCTLGGTSIDYAALLQRSRDQQFAYSGPPDDPMNGKKLD
jgi:hypothetical protein